MSNCLPLTRVLGSVASVEQTTLNGHKGVVVVRFQETISMAIDRLDGGVVGDGDMIWGDTDKFAMLFVGSMDR